MDQPNVNGSYVRTIGGFLAVIALLGGFFGTYKFIDDRYALAGDVRLLEKRLDYKVSDDQRFAIQQELRQIEERNLGKAIEKWDQRDRLRYKDLKDQLDKVLGKLKSLQ